MVASNNTYNVILTQDCLVDIVANIPDIDITVTFDINYDADDVIKELKVNNVLVEDFNGHDLSIKAGDRISVLVNSDYYLYGFYVNGEMAYYSSYSGYSAQLMNDTEFKIEVHPYSTYEITVEINDPTILTLYRGYGYENDVVELDAGENTVTMSERTELLTWEKTTGCYITAVTANGEDPQYSGRIETEPNMIVVFEGGHYVMDKTAVIWIDSKDVSGLSIGGGSYPDKVNLTADLVEGYNVVPFHDGSNPFEFYWYGTASSGGVYDNDVAIDKEYSWESWYATLEDKDVVKVFTGPIVPKATVTFEVEDGADATVTRDIIQPVEDFQDGFSCFYGTKLCVAAVDETNNPIKVSVNDEPVEADEAGAYNFDATQQALNVKIEKNHESGVASIIDNGGTDVVYYNLQGVRVDNPEKGIFVRVANGKSTKVTL